jgi:phage replication O-like protein O
MGTESVKRVGFRQISNELYKALIIADLTRACYKVILVVIHFTLGYNQRTEAEISLSTFSGYTGLSRPAVIQALRQLQASNMICLLKKGVNTHNSSLYALNIDFETWVTSKVHLTSSSKACLTSSNAKTLPDSSKNFTSPSKVATSKPPLLKKTLKENPLKKTIPTTTLTAPSESAVITPPLPKNSLEVSKPPGYVTEGDAKDNKLVPSNSFDKGGAVKGAAVKPVKVFTGARRVIDWPREKLRGDADAREDAYRDILFVLDYGNAPGRPEELLPGNLEDILREPPDSESWELIHIWFCEAQE